MFRRALLWILPPNGPPRGLRTGNGSPMFHTEGTSIRSTKKPQQGTERKHCCLRRVPQRFRSIGRRLTTLSCFHAFEPAPAAATTPGFFRLAVIERPNRSLKLSLTSSTRGFLLT